MGRSEFFGDGLRAIEGAVKEGGETLAKLGGDLAKKAQEAVDTAKADAGSAQSGAGDVVPPLFARPAAKASDGAYTESEPATEPEPEPEPEPELEPEPGADSGLEPTPDSEPDYPAEPSPNQVPEGDRAGQPAQAAAFAAPSQEPENGQGSPGGKPGKPGKPRRALKGIAAVAAALLIFGAGITVGD